jgi:signal transduction histidine kinase
MSRLTIRARLTLIYGAMFVIAGVVLLGLTYLLVDARLPGAIQIFRPGLNGQFRDAFTVPVEVGGDRMTLGDLPARYRQNTLNELLTQGGIALALVASVALAFGWLVATRTLQPLYRITDTARRIAAAPAADRSLHERIGRAGPRDLQELAGTFDAMLERLDHAFDGQRRFVANASHELRTPLTLNRSLLEVALRRPDASADLRQLGAVLLDINEQHERLIGGLLLLARSEQEVSGTSYVDLADVIEHVLDQAGTEAAAADVTVSAELAEAPVRGDPVLLEHLVRNLVENAIRHNRPGGRAWVSARVRPDGQAEFTVSNTGPTVPRYEIASLFEPFRRLPRPAGGPASGRGSPGPDAPGPGPAGVGLGLSIVRSIARAHGGDARVSSRDGGGLVVTITVPADGEPAP